MFNGFLSLKNKVNFISKCLEFSTTLYYLILLKIDLMTNSSNNITFYSALIKINNSNQQYTTTRSFKAIGGVKRYIFLQKTYIDFYTKAFNIN